MLVVATVHSSVCNTNVLYTEIKLEQRFLCALLKRPSTLATDSQSARDVSYNPEHHGKLKHVERRHFYIREAIEAHRLCVPFVRSDANLADFFTKPLKPRRFFELRDKIMNIKSPVMNITFPNAS